MSETSTAQYAVTKTIIARGTELDIPRAVLELSFIRVSQVNGCAYCVDAHVGLAERAYRMDGYDDATISRKFALAPGWRDAGDVYDAVERAALEIAEHVTLVASQRMPDEAYGRLRTLLGDGRLGHVAVVAKDDDPPLLLGQCRQRVDEVLLGDDVLSVFLMGCINMNVFNRIHLISGTEMGQP